MLLHICIHIYIKSRSYENRNVHKYIRFVLYVSAEYKSLICFLISSNHI